jgi:hypothetical protein
MKPHLCLCGLNGKHIKDSTLIYIFTLKIESYYEAECRSLMFLKALPSARTQMSTKIYHLRSANTDIRILHVSYTCTDSIPSFPMYFSQDSSGYDAVGNHIHGDRRTPTQGQHIQVAVCSLGDSHHVVAPPILVPLHHPPLDAHIYDTCSQSKIWDKNWLNNTTGSTESNSVTIYMHVYGKAKCYESHREMV